MAETNPQPVQEAAPQAAPTKGGGSLMGPIVAAIILVAGIAGIFEFMVKGALETTSAKNSFSDALNNHGVTIMLVVILIHVVAWLIVLT